MQHYVRVDFYRFKAFKSYSISLRHFNILVGPNNAGKSTILAAFRILAAALRRAGSKRAQMIHGPLGATLAYQIDLSQVSVASENVFYNYVDDEAATVNFVLSDGRSLQLYFPQQDTCYLIPNANGPRCETPGQFKALFSCPIGFVPILGPVDHHEQLYEKDAARHALFNYRAARNFRNIWYHYPEKFSEFQDAIRSTWPGMDVLPPEVDLSYGKPRLNIFCPEGRIPREIFWAGFGFQVWAQMLTHLIQSKAASIFLIDEPDIYLHSDLQRQLIGMLRSLGPDIIIATHSTEIITEAETEEIVVVNKSKTKSSRIGNPSQLESVFSSLGSNVNPILTQLGKTRKVQFVEGKDFQILSKFARKLNVLTVANRSGFAVVPMDGFNPERAKNLKDGMELTLGLTVCAAAILDRDYRSDAECKEIETQTNLFTEFAHVHRRKEIENFLLVPKAIDRAASRRVADRANRKNEVVQYTDDAEALLMEFAASKRSFVAGQHTTLYRRFKKRHVPASYDEVLSQESYEWFESRWKSSLDVLALIPGKEALSFINNKLREKYGVNLTTTAIIDAMKIEEVPEEMKLLIEKMKDFAAL